MESGFKKDAKYLDAPSANDRMRVRQAGLRDEIWTKAEVIEILDGTWYLLKDSKRAFRQSGVDLRKVPIKDDSETQDKDILVIDLHEYLKEHK